MASKFYNLVYKDSLGNELRGIALRGKNRTIEFEDGSIMSGSAVYSKLTFVGKLTFDGDLIPAKKETKNHSPWKKNPVNGFNLPGYLFTRLEESAKETA